MAVRSTHGLLFLPVLAQVWASFVIQERDTSSFGNCSRKSRSFF